MVSTRMIVAMVVVMMVVIVMMVIMAVGVMMIVWHRLTPHPGRPGWKPVCR